MPDKKHDNTHGRQLPKKPEAKKQNTWPRPDIDNDT